MKTNIMEETGNKSLENYKYYKFPPHSLDSLTNPRKVLMSTAFSPKKPITVGEFWWQFHIRSSKLAVRCFSTRLERSHPFRAEYNANHYVYQPYPTANWSSRNNEQVQTSSASQSHRLRQIPPRRHYFPNAACKGAYRRKEITYRTVTRCKRIQL